MNQALCYCYRDLALHHRDRPPHFSAVLSRPSQRTRYDLALALALVQCALALALALVQCALALALVLVQCALALALVLVQCALALGLVLRAEGSEVGVELSS